MTSTIFHRRRHPTLRLIASLGDITHKRFLGLTRMTLMITWEITVKCRNGSRLRFSERSDSAPNVGELVQTADGGQIVKARIDTCHQIPPKGGIVADYFQVSATEI